MINFIEQQLLVKAEYEEFSPKELIDKGIRAWLENISFKDVVVGFITSEFIF